MFSDQFKKDNEKITLDHEFLEQLKISMKQERARLNEEASFTNTSSKDEIKINVKENVTKQTWKQTLPIALSACAALALVVTVPNLFTRYKGENSTANSSEFSDTASITGGSSSNSEMSQSSASYSMEAEESASTTNDTTATEDRSNQFSDGNQESGTETANSKSDGSPVQDSYNMSKDQTGTADSNVTSKEQKVASDMPSEESNSLTATYGLEQDFLGFANLTFDEASLDLTMVNEFQPTEKALLTQQIAVFLNQEKGADSVSLDYAYDGRLILHDYYGMMVYDYEEESLLRIVDLRSRIGEYTTQGDQALNVTVFSGGHYLLLDTHHGAITDDSIYYLYDVQTDTMVSMTKKQLDTLNLPAKDSHLTYDTTAFDSLFQPGNRSLAASQLSENKQCILFYQSVESSTVASLSVCIATFDKSGLLTDSYYLPIFGDDAISQVKQSGSAFDGIINDNIK